MNNAYPQRVNWENYPSTNTALNASNLNKMDAALSEIDQRVVDMDAGKAEMTIVNQLIKSWTMDNATGDIEITFQNGAKNVIHTNLARIFMNFTYDRARQCMVIEYADGTTEDVSLSDFITEFEFGNTSTIGIDVDAAGKVTAKVLDESITEQQLEHKFLTNCRNAETNAKDSELSAEQHDLNAEAWAVGTRNDVDVDITDETYRNNAKFYAQQAMDAHQSINNYLNMATFDVDDDGNLIYENHGVNYHFTIDDHGDLNWEVK